MESSNEIHGLRIYTYIRELLDSGTSPEKVTEALVGKGVDPKHATTLIERAVEYDQKEQIRTQAELLVAKSISGADIERLLASKGFDRRVVAIVVKELIDARDQVLLEMKDDVGPIYRVLGIVIVLIGFALAGGNLSGLFPTFSFAGTTAIVLGLAVFVVGSRLGRNS